jgi:V-type H+-transporting ATPase subunit C
MSKNTKYLLVSVPASITPSGHKDDAIQALQKAAGKDYATVSPFTIPEFKIGTLDALIQQSEELAKLSGMCESVVSKVGDSLRNILEGDEAKIAQQKTVNDSWFSWDLARFNPMVSNDSIDRTSRAISTDILMEQSQISSR